MIQTIYVKDITVELKSVEKVPTLTRVVEVTTKSGPHRDVVIFDQSGQPNIVIKSILKKQRSSILVE